MAINEFDTLEGDVVQTERPANLCWGNPAEFITTLVQILKVRFPVKRNNQFIIAGNEVPGVDEFEKPWARFDKNRNPLGWHAFVKGQWRKFYTPAKGELRWFVGNSQTPPDGWQVIDTNISGMDTSVITKLKQGYVETSTVGVYSLFAARYIGY